MDRRCDDCKSDDGRLVGRWRERDGSRAMLCGPCKMKRWMATDGPKQLQDELEAVLGSDVEVGHG